MPEAATAETPKAPIETPERDWSKLGEIFGDEPETPAKDASVGAKHTTSGTASGTSTVIADPAKPADASTPIEPTPAELTQLDAFLKDSEKAQPVVEEPKAAPVAPEIAQLEAWKSNPDFAREAVHAAQSMVQLELAASNRDVPAVLGMFDPGFVEALMEHVYQANKEKIVQRFVDEHEGKVSKPDPEVARLRAELDGIKSTLTREEQTRQTQATQAQQAQARGQYKEYWNSLFRTVQVTDKKTQNLLRGWVLDSIADAAETGDKDALKTVQQIKQGRYASLGLKFREVYGDYLKNHKVQTTTETQTRNTQEQNTSGKLATATAAPTAASSPQDPDFDEDGKRTQSWWKRGLAKAGLD